MSTNTEQRPFRPGDVIVYRDAGSYNVALVDLVRDGRLTTFPFDRSKRRYQTRRKRVPVQSVIGQLPCGTAPQAVSEKLNALMNRHVAMRRRANKWLEGCVSELVEEAA